MTEEAAVARDALETSGYADLVAAAGQENAPPNGLESIRWWITNANIGAACRLLDLACSTGFSSRHIVRLAGCSAAGVDISEAALEVARTKAHGLDPRPGYVRANAEALPFVAKSFTHVVAGASFGFFQSPRKAAAEAFRVLTDDGRLCLDNFYYCARPPDSLVRAVNRLVGIPASASWSKSFWDRVFEEYFVLEAELDGPLEVESPQQALFRCAGIEGAALLPAAREAILRRLLFIRLVLNENRRYQHAVRQVWRVRR